MRGDVGLAGPAGEVEEGDLESPGVELVDHREEPDAGRLRYLDLSPCGDAALLADGEDPAQFRGERRRVGQLRGEGPVEAASTRHRGALPGTLWPIVHEVVGASVDPAGVPLRDEVAHHALVQGEHAAQIPPG